MTKTRLQQSLGVAVVAAALALTAMPGLASALPKQATAISGIAFHGSHLAPGPEIVITGKEFGTKAPKGTPNTCSGATGDGFGNSLGFIEDTRQWVAGYSSSSGTACVGIIINSWSPTKIVIHLGSDYAGYGNLEAGDNFVMQVGKAYFGGVVAYT